MAGAPSVSKLLLVFGTVQQPVPVAAQPSAVTCQGFEALESIRFGLASELLQQYYHTSLNEGIPSLDFVMSRDRDFFASCTTVKCFPSFLNQDVNIQGFKEGYLSLITGMQNRTYQFFAEI